MRFTGRLAGMVNDVRARARRDERVRRSGNAAAHTSVVTVLVPTAEWSERISSFFPDGESADEIHCTLQFLGKAAACPVDRSVLDDALVVVAALYPPITVPVLSVRRLGNDTPPATVLLLGDGPDEIRAGVKRRVPDMPPPKFPTYKPHVTVGYGVSLEPLYPLIGEQITFDRIALWWADERDEYPLAGLSL